MALIGMRNVCITFGRAPLLDHISFYIEPRERVCLLRRNGAGKSTLMGLLHGDISPDEGEIVRQQGIRVALLPQDVSQSLSGTVLDIVSGGLDASSFFACRSTW
jgi:ATP-binding cassette subfamily F protein uup